MSTMLCNKEKTISTQGETMKFLKYLLLLSFMTLIISLPANAAIKLSTEKFEFNVKPGDNYITGSFTVQNDDNEEIRFKAYPEYFEISEEGTIHTGLNKANSEGITKNIRFNPTEFTLTPNSSQKIRFTITNVQNLPEGESRAALFLENAKTKQQALPANGARTSASLVIKTRIAVPIYVEKGRIIKTGSIDSINLKKFKNKYVYDLTVKSSGNSLIRAGGVGQIIKDDQLVTEFPINERPIQGGSAGKFKDIMPTTGLSSNQQYKLKLTLKYKDQNQKEIVLKDEKAFTLSEIN